ncbi:hypothetical protein P8452_76112 [Trifolium repens]|nr:hypothetical protein P8452_76112 [Trifolium repens]
MFRKIGFLRTRAIRGHMKAAIDNPPTARVKEKITAELAKVPYPERVLCRKEEANPAPAKRYAPAYEKQLSKRMKTDYSTGSGNNAPVLSPELLQYRT